MGAEWIGFQRYELKYHIPRSMIPKIRELARPHVEHDVHCRDLPGKAYTVRSIYFDSKDLGFYFEKLDSVCVRKKLRVRTYNLPRDRAAAFLEIKRKIGRLGRKERLMLDLEKVNDALNGKDPQETLPDLGNGERQMLDRFRFNLKTSRLDPVVLVVYEREAFIGRTNDRWRMTLDQNIRSLINPSMDQIFEEEQLQAFEDRYFVLELKFDDFMPRWMTNLVSRLNLRPQAYSKYVKGIDAWTPHAR